MGLPREQTRAALAAFMCLFILHTLPSSHRMVLASQFTSSLVFLRDCGEFASQRHQFVHIPRDGSPDNVRNPFRATSFILIDRIVDPGLHFPEQLVVDEALTSRVMYRRPVQLRMRSPLEQSADRRVLSFSTSFRVTVVDRVRVNDVTTDLPVPYGVEGLAFILVPDAYTVGEAGGYLGFLDSHDNASSSTTSAAVHTFGVELDFVKNKEFQDADPNHVGINVGSMTSVAVANAEDVIGGQRDLEKEIHVWIQYHSPTSMLEIWEASPLLDPAYDTSSYRYPNPRRPQRPDQPTLATHIDLAKVTHDFMYVGFSTVVRSCKTDFNTTVAALTNLTCEKQVDFKKWCFQTFPPDSNASITVFKNCLPKYQFASRDQYRLLLHPTPQIFELNNQTNN